MPLCPTIDAAVNVTILAQVQETVLTMKKHKILRQCWTDTKVLEIQDGGQLAPFDAVQFCQAMTERPTCSGAAPEETDYTYECLSCMSPFNFLATATPGVRISAGQLERAIAQDFPTGKPFTRISRPFVIQVPHRSWDPQAHRGMWILATGLERLLALIQVSVRCLNDDKLAKQYRTMCRNLKVIFMLVSNSRLSMTSFQLRENCAEDGDIERFSALQKIEFIFKQYKSSTSKDVLQRFQNFKMSSSSEKLTYGLLEQIICVGNRLLSSTVSMTCLREIENMSASRAKNPFSSISKLSVVATKCRTAENIEWFLQMVVLGMRRNFVTQSDLTQKQLSQSTCTLMLMKRELLHYFMEQFMDKHGFPSDTRTALHDSMSTFEKLYEHCLDKSTGEPTERSFLRCLSESGRRLLLFVESLVYRDTFDGTIKTGMKHGKSASEILEYTVLQNEVSSIVQRLQTERKVAQAADIAAQALDKVHATQEQDGIAVSDGGNLKVQNSVTAMGPLHCSENDILAPVLAAYVKSTAENQAMVMAVIEAHYRQYCRLFVSNDMSELKQELKTSDLAMSAGSDSGTVLYHWDLALSSEALTHPAERIPSFAADTYNKTVRCLMESRSGPSFNSETDVAHLGPGEIVLLLNGGRHSTGLTKLLQTPWNHTVSVTDNLKTDDLSGEPVDRRLPPAPVSHNIMVVKDLKSMQARRSVNRHSLCSFNQAVGTHNWTIT